jgi:AcrR family transcriptional regulator
MAEPTVRTRRRPGEARELLVQAARDLFARQGYAGTSTRQIADHAGVAEVLIFRHFTTKKGLFEAAIVVPFSQLFDEWLAGAAARAESESPDELVADYIAGLYPLLLTHRDLVLAMVAALAHEAEIDDAAADSLGEAFAHIEAFTAEQMERQGITGLDLPVTVRVAAAMVIGTTLLDPWLFGGGRRRPSRQRIIDEMSSFMARGVIDRGSQASS